MSEDGDYDPLESLMDMDQFEDDDWVTTAEQREDVGRDPQERDEHPLGDSETVSDEYDVDPSQTNHDA